MRKIYILVAAILINATLIFGQVKINEIFINPPGTDNGQEFFELKGPASMSLAGYTLLIIEGDAASAGIIDQALDLTGQALGTNGLFLRRDAATVLVPAPDAATVLQVLDINPDIENGTNTFLLVTTFTGAVGNDLDTDNNGTFDVALPWAVVIDGIAVTENDGALNYVYADDVGFPVFPSTVTVNPDQVSRDANDSWFASDITGTSPGPYNYINNTVFNTAGVFVPTSGYLTPGSSNIFVLPVSFSAIRASQQIVGIKIEWSNLTETDILNYTIERSSDGRTFNAIGIVTARLNNGTKTDYYFLDTSPAEGLNFYRINAIGINGSSKYSIIVRVNTKGGKTDILIYPNPVSGNQVSFQISDLPKGQYSIRINNASGQEVYNKILLHDGGAVTEALQLPATIKTGIYSLRLSGGEVKLTKTFIVR